MADYGKLTVLHEGKGELSETGLESGSVEDAEVASGESLIGASGLLGELVAFSADEEIAEDSGFQGGLEHNWAEVAVVLGDGDLQAVQQCADPPLGDLEDLGGQLRDLDELDGMSEAYRAVHG